MTVFKTSIKGTERKNILMMKMKKLAIYKISELNSHYYKQIVRGLGWSGDEGQHLPHGPFLFYIAY